MSGVRGDIEASVGTERHSMGGVQAACQGRHEGTPLVAGGEIVAQEAVIIPARDQNLHGRRNLQK
jgi:hypothetical protein